MKDELVALATRLGHFLLPPLSSLFSLLSPCSSTHHALPRRRPRPSAARRPATVRRERHLPPLRRGTAAGAGAVRRSRPTARPDAARASRRPPCAGTGGRADRTRPSAPGEPRGKSPACAGAKVFIRLLVRPFFAHAPSASASFHALSSRSATPNSAAECCMYFLSREARFISESLRCPSIAARRLHRPNDTTQVCSTPHPQAMEGKDVLRQYRRRGNSLEYDPSHLCRTDDF